MLPIWLEYSAAVIHRHLYRQGWNLACLSVMICVSSDTSLPLTHFLYLSDLETCPVQGYQPTKVFVEVLDDQHHHKHSQQHKGWCVALARALLRATSLT